MNRGDKARMKKVLVIGMGVGDPDQLTVQAVQALNRTDVFFVMDKGPAKTKLRALREEILRRHAGGSALDRKRVKVQGRLRADGRFEVTEMPPPLTTAPRSTS